MLTIPQIKQAVAEYFKDKPVKDVYLFGSYARGEARENSDLDLLFSLKENARVTYFGLARYLVDLEEKLFVKIDLVEEEQLYPRLKKYVDQDKMLIFSNR